MIKGILFTVLLLFSSNGLGQCPMEDLGDLEEGVVYSRQRSEDDCVGLEGEGNLFTFFLPTMAVLSIELKSDDDSFLEIFAGIGDGGQLVAENDDGGRLLNARVRKIFRKGEYTIKARGWITYLSSGFELTVKVGDFTYPMVSAPRVNASCGKLDGSHPLECCYALERSIEVSRRSLETLDRKLEDCPDSFFDHLTTWYVTKTECARISRLRDWRRFFLDDVLGHHEFYCPGT